MKSKKIELIQADEIIQGASGGVGAEGWWEYATKFWLEREILGEDWSHSVATIMNNNILYIWKLPRDFKCFHQKKYEVLETVIHLSQSSHIYTTNILHHNIHNDYFLTTNVKREIAF